MLLTAKTTVYITSQEATSEMSFLDLWNAIKGKLDLSEVEITIDPDESRALDRKRLARREVQHLMANMTAQQAERVVELLRSDDELMELHDDYAQGNTSHDYISGKVIRHASFHDFSRRQAAGLEHRRGHGGTYRSGRMLPLLSLPRNRKPRDGGGRVALDGRARDGLPFLTTLNASGASARFPLPSRGAMSRSLCTGPHPTLAPFAQSQGS
ncbi:MAG: hypothetical protein ACQESR_05760 [Planctomycetota bacterium]